MSAINKIVLFVTLSTISVCTVLSQEVKVELNTKELVYIGDIFSLTYKVNTAVEEIALDSEFKGLEVRNGPSRSKSTSMSIKDGVSTKTEHISFTYYLKATKAGVYDLPKASVTIDGVKYFSEQKKIKIEKRENNPTDSSLIGADELFIEFEIEQTNIYKQQPIAANLTVYYTVNLNSLNEVNLPLVNDFLIYELTRKHSTEEKKVLKNGKQYKSRKLVSYLLYPVKSGKLKIDPVEVVCEVRQASKSNGSSVFDDFFGSYVTREIAIYSKPVYANINEYPEEIPTEFTQICSDSLKTSVSLSQHQVAQNQTFQYELTVSGTGNLKLLSAPELNLPEGLEVVSTNSTNIYTGNSKVFTSKMKFVYTILAYKPGEFKIPSATFNYFNLSKNRFDNIASPVVLLTVVKDKNKSQTSVNKVSAERQVVKNLEGKEAVMVVLDGTNSMLAHDIIPNRKTLAIEELSDGLAEMGQLSGGVIFGSVPYIWYPFAETKNIKADILFHETPNVGEYKRVGNALALAIHELRKVKAESKRILLITDGWKESGAFGEGLAAKLAINSGIQISIIGLSDKIKEAPITVNNGLMDVTSSIPVILNDEELTSLAGITGGKYYRATDRQSFKSALKSFNQNVGIPEKLEANTAFSEREINSILNVALQDIIGLKQMLKN